MFKSSDFNVSTLFDIGPNKFLFVKSPSLGLPPNPVSVFSQWVTVSNLVTSRRWRFGKKNCPFLTHFLSSSEFTYVCWKCFLIRQKYISSCRSEWPKHELATIIEDGHAIMCMQFPCVSHLNDEIDVMSTFMTVEFIFWFFCLCLTPIIYEGVPFVIIKNYSTLGVWLTWKMWVHVSSFGRPAGLMDGQPAGWVPVCCKNF